MNKPTLNPKKPLTEAQAADAARLIALWDSWQERTKAEGKRPVTQGEFGYRYELGSQGMVWQYLHGRTPLNLKAVMAFAVAFGCAIEDISPTLAATATKAAKAVSYSRKEEAPRDTDAGPSPEAVMLSTMLDSIKDSDFRLRVMMQCVSVIVQAGQLSAPIPAQAVLDAVETPQAQAHA